MSGSIRLRTARKNAWTRSSTFRVETPGLGDHSRERLRPAPRLEQPPREVAAMTQLRDLQPDRADPRVPEPCAVGVAAVDPVVAPLAVAGAADGVDLCAHEQVHHLGEQRLQRVGSSLFDLLAQPLDRVDAGHGGHRSLSLSESRLATASAKLTRWSSFSTLRPASVHHLSGR
jgi:hypothetical protein